MIRWPGKVPARKRNEMLAIHDFWPTFAALLGDKLPTFDRSTDATQSTEFQADRIPEIRKLEDAMTAPEIERQWAAELKTA